MLQLYLSKNLERKMAAHLQPVAVSVLHPQQWYLQKVRVLRRKCIMAMEEKSRYAMVFCGLTKSEFAIFPDLFQERLWRETMAICQMDEADNARLSDLVLRSSRLQSYQIGNDRSVQAHLKEAIWRFQWGADEIGRLPEDLKEHFFAGLRINDTVRSSRGSKEYFAPLERFRAGWLRQLGIATT